MRKFFTLLSLFFCGLAVQAQTLTFRHEGKEILNGSTVYSSKLDPESAKPELNMGPGLDFRTIKFIPEITLTGTTTAKIHIELNGDDKRWAVCSFGGCVTGTLIQQEGTLTAGEVLDPEIHFENSIGNYGEILTKTATISAWYDGNEASKVSFTLIVSNDPLVLSVDDAKTAAEAVTVSGKTLSYSFAKSAARTLSVYTLGGAQVLSQALEAAAGTVSLSALPAGVYVYRISGDAVPADGKFIIR